MKQTPWAADSHVKVEDREPEGRDRLRALSLDVSLALTFINPAAEQMIGWKAHEILGQMIHDVLHHTRSNGKPYPIDQCPIYATFKDGQAYDLESEMFWRKDGTAFPVEGLSTPMWDDGKMVGAVVTFHDVTERKQTEATLKDQKT
jgi:PAS domain S-box-containing protein